MKWEHQRSFFAPISSLAGSNVCPIAQMGHKCAKQEKMALIGEKRRERRVVQVMSSDLKLCSSKHLRQRRLVQVMSSDLKVCSSKGPSSTATCSGNVFRFESGFK